MTTKNNTVDTAHMRTALTLARRGLGRVAPNPAVGCILVKDNIVVGRGVTQPGGRPHAETVALLQAGNNARGGTAYVTLEPCAHHGKTPPCADALIMAGIKRIVIAVTDPDPRVDGKGIAKLQAAGCEVAAGILEQEARALNAGFFSCIENGRPDVTLKFATSRDGKITNAASDSPWITGIESRRRGHLMRAESDAILIGIGTALADNPTLDCRLDGLQDRPPIRIVLDSRLRLPEDSKLVQTADRIPLWIITEAKPVNELNRTGVEQIKVPDMTDLLSILQRLAKRGVTRLLVEGGGEINSSFLCAGLVDHIAWFRAPNVIGEDGKSVADQLADGKLSGLPDFQQKNIMALGQDVLETWDRLD